jgi:hypothetical protein
VKRFAIIAALVLVTAAPALADPTSDLEGAFVKLAAAKSYRVSTAMPSGPAMKIEIVNPGRSHSLMDGMEIIVIDNTTYTKMGGKWQKQTSPVAAGSGASMAQPYATPGPGSTIRDLGMKTVAGASLHAYAVQKSASAPTGTIFVDGNGMVARMEAPGPRGTIVMSFSDFNAPISIVAPI